MGQYISQTDVLDVFGNANVTRWSNLDNDDTAINATRVTAAINYAEQVIDDRFRSTEYAVPLTHAASGELYVVKDWAAKLAGIWLYQCRGFDDRDLDEDPEAARLTAMKQAVHDEIGEYFAGQRELAATKTTASGASAPIVVL